MSLLGTEQGLETTAGQFQLRQHSHLLWGPPPWPHYIPWAQVPGMWEGKGRSSLPHPSCPGCPPSVAVASIHSPPGRSGFSKVQASAPFLSGCLGCSLTLLSFPPTADQPCPWCWQPALVTASRLSGVGTVLAGGPQAFSAAVTSCRNFPCVPGSQCGCPCSWSWTRCHLGQL